MIMKVWLWRIMEFFVVVVVVEVRLKMKMEVVRVC
jgi:hypothetical protein